jgi:SAM-dependent methyltransferase
LVASEDVWLRSTWSFVRSHLPAAPSRVVELGCGDHGGHLSALHDAGYDAVGVDPQAPDGPAYHQIPFEEYHADRPMDAVLASLSLHHVTDPGEVLDQVRDLLMPGGTLVIIEWAWEHFDEATAQWCFRRLPRIDADGDGWLHRRQAGWAQSGLPWDRFCHNWAQEHGLHTAGALRPELDTRFTMTHASWGPYYFPELAHTDEAAEQAAIDAGQIRACCLRYVGRRPGV